MTGPFSAARCSSPSTFNGRRKYRASGRIHVGRLMRRRNQEREVRFQRGSDEGSGSGFLVPGARFPVPRSSSLPAEPEPEPGTWNPEPGTWNPEPEPEPRSAFNSPTVFVVVSTD